MADFLKRQKGASILEVLIGFLILTIALAGILQLFSHSKRTMDSSAQSDVLLSKVAYSEMQDLASQDFQYFKTILNDTTKSTQVDRQIASNVSPYLNGPPKPPVSSPTVYSSSWHAPKVDLYKDGYLVQYKLMTIGPSPATYRELVKLIVSAKKVGSNTSETITTIITY